MIDYCRCVSTCIITRLNCPMIQSAWTFFPIVVWQELTLSVYNTVRISLNETSVLTVLSWTGRSIIVLNTASTIGVFICLTWMASMTLEALAKEIKLKSEIPFMDSSHAETTIKNQLIKWRRDYGLICEFVDQINRCFGFILLVFVTDQFIICITYSFSILLDLEKDIVTPTTLYYFQILIFYLSYITLTTTICHGIQKQVYSTVNCVFIFEHNHSSS